MEETGIIRRLDALGRIVIPREFRKLNRIEVGDPLEMRAFKNGEIVLRKVDVSAKLKSIGEMAIETLSMQTSLAVAICSGDKWLCAGSHAKALANSPLSDKMKHEVEKGGKAVLSCEQMGINLPFRSAFAFPVIGENGAYGALVAFKNEALTDTEAALVANATFFTAKSIQNF